MSVLSACNVFMMTKRKKTFSLFNTIARTWLLDLKAGSAGD